VGGPPTLYRFIVTRESPLPRGERDRVRGYWTEVVDRRQNGLEHAIDFGEHLVIPEAQHQVPHRFQLGRSFGVRRSANSVLSTIELNDDVVLEAGEVRHEIADRRLTLELEAVQLPGSQMLPQHLFGIGHATTQDATNFR